MASKMDAFFAVQAAVTPTDLTEFLLATEIVLSEKDPALELPEDKRAFANLYRKSREHSGPGTDNETGKINEKDLRTWVKEAQSLCAKYGRAEIGDQKIGQILSAPIIGDDGVWPCKEVRSVLEECGTADIAKVHMGVYNSRGAHFRGEGGGEERALAEKYRNWSRKLAFENPYVASVVEGIAETYDREAAREDSEAAVRRRLRH